MPNNDRPDAKVYVVASSGPIDSALRDFAGVYASPRAVTINHRFHPDMEVMYTRLRMQLAGFRPGVDYLLISGRAITNFVTGMFLSQLLQGQTVDILQFDTQNKTGFLCDTVTFPSYGEEGIKFEGNSVFTNFIAKDAPYLQEHERITFDNDKAR